MTLLIRSCSNDKCNGRHRVRAIKKNARLFRLDRATATTDFVDAEEYKFEGTSVNDYSGFSLRIEKYSRAFKRFLYIFRHIYLILCHP